MNIDQILHRLFRTLAEEHEYTITDDEIGVYIATLSRHGLPKIKEAVLSLIATTDVNANVFPSVFEMEKVIFNLNKLTDR